MSTNSLKLPPYSIGVGDRFAQQAKAQLQACILAGEAGFEVVPVWNKSNREHNIVGSEPSGTRQAADEAVAALHWDRPYFLDADHIGLGTVGRFLQPCDFFTIDVADAIGKAASEENIRNFALRHPELQTDLDVPGIDRRLHSSAEFVTAVARKYLAAVEEAARVYAHIAGEKGEGRFIPEISMDETDTPQTPAELLVVLTAIADAGIPIQTIAPKFTGRFNKGVDYQGDVPQFAREFAEDVAVIAYAIKHYGLPDNLKMSVHSGSDKFSIYSSIHDVCQRTGSGVHLKTAGTTWLEELIGLAEAGGSGLEMAKEIYREALAHQAELCVPYASVIAIDDSQLPSADKVGRWSSEQFVAALRHDQHNAAYNPSFRQLLHVGFKIAAKLGERYTAQVRDMEAVIARNVTSNLYDRHIKPVFLGVN